MRGGLTNVSQIGQLRHGADGVLAGLLLRPGLVVDEDTILPPTVSVAPVPIQPDVVQDLDTILPPGLSRQIDLQPRGRAESGGGVQLSNLVSLRAGDRSTSAGSANLVVDRVLSPAALQDADTISAPTVSPGAVSVAPDALQDSDTILTSLVAESGNAVAPDVLQDADTILSPTVTPGAAPVAPNALQDIDTILASTVAPGAVTVTLNTLQDTDTILVASLAVGAVSLLPDVLQDADTILSPTLAPGAVTVSPNALQDADTILSPTVAVASSGVNVQTGTFASAESGANSNTLSFSYDAGSAGSNRRLVIFAGCKGFTSNTVASIDYNSVAADEHIDIADTSSGFPGVAMYSLEAPATGINTLEVTFSAANTAVKWAAAVVIDGADQTTATDGTAQSIQDRHDGSGEISVTHTTSNAGSVVFMATASQTAGRTLTPLGSMTSLGTFDTSNSSVLIAFEIVDPAGAITAGSDDASPSSLRQTVVSVGFNAA